MPETEKLDTETVVPASASMELVKVELPPLLPLDQNPAAIYLASLRSVGRRGMRRALTAIVETIKGESSDPLDFPLIRSKAKGLRFFNEIGRI